ncbi:MAG: acyltransferase family protein [Clostridia bacterium]
MENEISKKKSNRVIYFDILNIIAIIAVIAMHCNSIVHGKPNSTAWTTSLVIECICYFAVPLFCMLSGATLMNYREKYDTKTFFKKRLLKVAIPFIFWAIIMFVWKIHIGWINIQSINIPIKFINAFFANKEEATYYFMFIILGLYLTMPLLSLLAKKEYTKQLWFVVLLYFIFNAFLPNILELFKIQLNTNLTVQLGGYAIFIILGYLLSTQNITKKYRILIYAGAIIGLIYRFATTFYLSKQAGSVVKTTWGYTSWHAILLTAAVFLIIKNLNFEKIITNSKVRNFITKMSG